MSTSRSVTIIGIVLLLWNLMGVAAWVMQYGMDLTGLAKTDPVGARIFAEMPSWLWVVYAVAVGAGTLGALLLLMKKAAAATLFLVSLIAVLVQFGYTLGATDLIAQKGIVVAAGFPALVILIAIVQLAYARSLVAKDVLR
ncbi:sugar transporter [Sphingobium olei]|uniref:Sugar transporter n=1 Tax=Sphingobium olei TaxID=420955 RepID=A0ABW3P3V9_9SPHN|nr:sugar transporter [Sphingobium sp.]